MRILGPRTHLLLAAMSMTMVPILSLNISTLEALLGLYDVPQAGGRWEVVLSGYSAAPFTSIINVRDVESIVGNVAGARVVYEALAPAVVGGEVVVIRGLGPGDLGVLTGYEVVRGSDLLPGCGACALVGESLASRIGVDVGGVLVARPVFVSEPQTLLVVGIIRAGRPYSEEVITSFDVAAQARGLGRGQASLALVVADSEEAYRAVLERAGRAPIPKALVERALVAVARTPRGVEAVARGSFADLALSRLGVPREILTSAVLAVTALLSLGMFVAGSSAAFLNLPRLRILYEQGVSSAAVRAGLAASVAAGIAAGALASPLAAWAAAHVFSGISIVYPVEVRPSPLSEVAAPLQALAAGLAGAARSRAW